MAESTMSTTPVKTLFLPLYSLQGASSRYRVYNYADKLPHYGIAVRILHPRSYTLLSKAIYTLSLIPALQWADVVFIQKKLFRAPLFALIRSFNKPIIFDFDDSLHVDESILDMLAHVLRASRHVVVGNKHLEQYARRFTDHVARIPTPVDVNVFMPAPDRNSSPDSIVTIGWIGMGGNQSYIEALEPVFEELYRSQGDRIQLKVISDRFFEFRRCRIRIVNVPWSLETELKELQSIDIGIMPLTDDELSRGKCAFKALQYMSVGVPTVASPVGMNCDVVRHGQNGLLALSGDEWTNALGFLIDHAEKRKQMGKEARKTVAEEYSYEATTPLLASVIKSARGPGSFFPGRHP